jgi:hypothetical protein
MKDNPTSKLTHPDRQPESKRLLQGRLWCAACARLVRMANVEQAASMADQTVESLSHRIDNQTLHYLKQQCGGVLICLDSLLRRNPLLNP